MAVLRGLLETGLAYGNTWIFKEVVEAFTRSDATGPAAKALLVAAVTALDEDDGERARTCMNEAGSEPEVRSTCCSGAWVQRRDALPARTRAGANEACDSGSHRLRAQAPRGGVRSAAQEVLAALRSARVCASSMYGACSVFFVFLYLYLWIPCCCASTPRRGRTATEISAAVGLPGIGYIEDDLHVTLGVWAVVYTMHGADPPTEVTHPKAPKPTSQLREVRASVACVLVWFPSVVDCGLG